MILSVFSVLMFCICCHQLIRSLSYSVPVFNSTAYSKSALRLAKIYRVVAWAIMSGAFLIGLASSFYQVYTQV